MAFCSKCGYEVMDGEKFCEKCGTHIRINGGTTYKSENVCDKKIEREEIKQEIIHTFPWFLLIIGLMFITAGNSPMKIGGSIIAILGVIAACVKHIIHKNSNSKDIEVNKKSGCNKSQFDFESWNPFVQTGWIILNFYTIGIPQIIYVKKHMKFSAKSQW